MFIQKSNELQTKCLIKNITIITHKYMYALNRTLSQINTIRIINFINKKQKHYRHKIVENKKPLNITKILPITELNFHTYFSPPKTNKTILIIFAWEIIYVHYSHDEFYIKAFTARRFCIQAPALSGRMTQALMDSSQLESLKILELN